MTTPQQSAMRKALEALETYQRYNKFLDVCNPAIESLQAALAQQATLVPQEWTNLLAYALQDDMHNRLTPRVIDIAYTAFTLAKRANKEDGGASDWFNDTKPTVTQMIASLKADLIAEFSDKQKATRSFPERDTSKPAEGQGIFHKFTVNRVDGSDQPGGKHEGCDYFVLDMDHDPHAKAAIQAYALSCAQSHPQLSAELLARYPLEVVKPLGFVSQEELEYMTAGGMYATVYPTLEDTKGFVPVYAGVVGVQHD